MQRTTLLASVVLLGMGFGYCCSAADDRLAESIAEIDPVVAAADEKAALTDMLGTWIRDRRQQLIHVHNTAWKTVDSKEAWEAYRKPRLEALRQSLGEYPPPPNPLPVRETGTVRGDGFVIENLVFESRPGLWVSANLYRPISPPESMPGILIVHSHHTPKENGELQDMGMTWARAGCLVLVMDQIGHGERRQHPFVDESSSAKPFRVSRQDYYFRYDNGIRCQLAGDSLIGWMAWDLMRGVDLLLGRKGIDPKRIILLGSVAGGGDPAAVTAALDERITAVVPFNFGGPQPETRFPLPDDIETSYNFAGSGSWESTRNLRRSTIDGFMPWVIVGSIAPRRLVYAHEFNWDRERDPVWKRLKTIYGWYGCPENLAYTHGRGELRLRPPEATHCTHIGAAHRARIHEAFRTWFGIEVAPETEYSNRVPAELLRCFTPALLRELKPKTLGELLGQLAEERRATAIRVRDGKSQEQQRQQLRSDLAKILGPIEPGKATVLRSNRTSEAGLTIEKLLIEPETGIRVPVVLLLPKSTAGKEKRPCVIGVTSGGKGWFLQNRSREIAGLVRSGISVCLIDVRGTGETAAGSSRGRTSTATGRSSSLLMLGETQLGGQLRDLRSVLAWLRTRADVDASRIALWGDSPARPNSRSARTIVPRDDDSALPGASEPTGATLALLGGLYDDSIAGIYAHGGVVSYREILNDSLVMIPHDVVIPELLKVGDSSDIAAALAPVPLALDEFVNSHNELLSEEEYRTRMKLCLSAYRQVTPPASLSFVIERPQEWFLQTLQPGMQK